MKVAKPMLYGSRTTGAGGALMNGGGTGESGSRDAKVGFGLAISVLTVSSERKSDGCGLAAWYSLVVIPWDDSG